MSIIKHPIILALLTASIVFAITYYYYNYVCASTAKKKSKNGKKEKKIKGEINETIVISSAIAGLIAWYIATSYFTEKNENNSLGEELVGISQNTKPKIMKQATMASIPMINSRPVENIPNVVGGSSIGGDAGYEFKGKLMGGSKTLTVDSEDQRRSYNLIGSGIDIPRSELKIPNVLIDYH